VRGLKLFVRPAVVAVACLAAAVAFGACGGDDDGADSQASSNGAAAKQAEGEPFKVMYIAAFETQTGDQTEMVTAAKATAKVINETEGGLGGRPIEVLQCSHNGLADIAAKCARDAVQENVDNMIEASTFMAASLPITGAAGIPHIASMASAPDDFKDELTFPLGTPTSMTAVAVLPEALADPETVRIASLSYEGIETSEDRIRQAKRLVGNTPGKEWVGEVRVPLTATQFAPVAQRLADLEPDLIFLGMTNTASVAVINAAQQIGLDAKYLHSAWTLGEIEIGELSDKGASLVLGAGVPPARADLEGTKKFLADLEAGGADMSEPENEAYAAVKGWLDMWALKRLSERVEGDVTKEAMIEATEAATADNPVDLFGLLSWTPGEEGPSEYANQPNAETYALKVVDGKLELLSPEPVDAWDALNVQ
jgi:branched-chain amino acid transport system substrate-binding protein